MKLLISGGTGLIGQEIIKLSLIKGVNVNVLTRNKSLSSKIEGLKYFYWNPSENIINGECFKGVDVVINLSGFNVFNYWSKRNKLKIINSRVKSTEFILSEINKRNIKLKSFISASGIAAYKSSYSNSYNENDSVSDKNSFINQVVINWESKVLEYKKIMPSTSFSIMRIGLVLSKETGLYNISNRLARFYMLSPIGDGHQWQSWIHISDVASAFLRSSQEAWNGTYNLVSPNPVTQKVMLESIAKHANRRIIFPNIPVKLVNLFLGEVAEIMNSSHKVNPQMLIERNFKYNFATLDQALANLKG
jgi:hypothetical protein